MSTEPDRDQAGLTWQTDVWNRMSQIYQREFDRRFVPVIEHVIARAGLKPGERALDLGAGTGSVALRAATLVAPGGRVNRKSTRLNSSHLGISYAVFCLKKKN